MWNKKERLNRALSVKLISVLFVADVDRYWHLRKELLVHRHRLTDEQWEQIAALFPKIKRMGRPRPIFGT